MTTPIEPVPAPELKRRAIPSQCADCGAPYNCVEVFVFEAWQWGSRLCPACEDKLAREKIAPPPLWLTRWEAMTPADMRKAILRDYLKDPGAHDQAMAWNFQTLTSLLLVGDTGLAKSRTLYAKLAVVLQANPRLEVEKFDSISFGEESKARSYTGRGAEWFTRLRRVDLVVFDDLFRGNLTGGIQEELFALISARCEEGLPMIATTQFTNRTLNHVMQEHHVAAICRRFQDHFTVVHFKRPKTESTKPKD